MDQSHIIQKIFKHLTLNDIFSKKLYLLRHSWYLYLKNHSNNKNKLKILPKPKFLEKNLKVTSHWLEIDNSKPSSNALELLLQKTIGNDKNHEVIFQQKGNFTIDQNTIFKCPIRDIYCDFNYVYLIFKNPSEFHFDVIYQIELESIGCPIADIRVIINNRNQSSELQLQTFRKQVNKNNYKVICSEDIYVKELNYMDSIYYQIKVLTNDFFKHLQNKSLNDLFNLKITGSLLYLGDPNGKHLDKPNGKHVGKPNDKHLGKPNGKHLGKPNGKHLGKPNGKHLGKHMGNPNDKAISNKILHWSFNRDIPLIPYHKGASSEMMIDFLLLMGMTMGMAMGMTMGMAMGMTMGMAQSDCDSSHRNIEYFEVRAPKNLLIDIQLLIGTIGLGFKFIKEEIPETQDLRFILPEISSNSPLLFSDRHLLYSNCTLILGYRYIPNTMPIIHIRLKLNNRYFDSTCQIPLGNNVLVYGNGICGTKKPYI